jgi:sulfite reductase (NADPH) flavoprotein alpha-component
MLAEHKIKILQDLVSNASKEELAWMHGYIAGQLAPAPAGNAAVSVNLAVNKITIAYGTETGNSKRVATDFAAKAKKAGIHAKVVSLDQYRLPDLPKEEYFLTIISTQGEGEPPEAAKKFYDHIHQNGFKLDKLQYSVLALGDTSYPLFCKAGDDIDVQLQKLGGKRLADIQRCDVEFDEDANKWFANVMKKITAVGFAAAAAPISTAAAVAEKKPAGKKNYTGTVLTNINLNDRGSNKTTWHLEIGADEVEYEPGDSIGIVPENPALAVEKILSLSKGTNAGKRIDYKKESFTIFDLLKYKLNTSHLITAVIKRYAGIVGHEINATRMDLADLLQAFPVKDAEQFEEVLSVLNPMAPRLYTMASSPAAHSGEVHAIVARDIFTANGEEKYGVCSTYLGGLQLNTPVQFFVQKNKRFRLPAADKDIIMIGPGTGIAPFRSFLFERDATGATGKNWLFFGEQHFITDFLYQTELQNFFETGVLNKISLAFSRDQPEKIYVQHRMHEQGAELYNWVKNGAYVYLCGKKDPMSVDVEHTLVAIIEKFGEKTAEEAKEYFQQMQHEGRYAEDVY